MAETLMWGERGLVATFFLDLSLLGDSICGWKQFFKEIKFPGPGPGLDWEKLVDVQAVVEPSFGTQGFGSPDLVARVDFKDGTDEYSAAVLLEAKNGTFAENTVAPTSRHKEGFNSQLNGQIELNHRLALALQEPNRSSQLREPDWVIQTPYHRSGAPRRVNEPSVLKKLVTLLRGPSVRQYLHVAVTSDDTSPLTEPSWGYLPQLFNRNGDDCWEKECGRFGWIGWGVMKSLAMSWPASREKSLFLKSYELNEHYLTKKPPEVPGPPDALPINWPPHRPQVGVSLIHAPAVSTDACDTAVHFSWRRNSCAIRRYYRLEPESKAQVSLMSDLKTLDILHLIEKEQRYGARPPVTDTEAWFAIIEDMNAAWGLHPNHAS